MKNLLKKHNKEVEKEFDKRVWECCDPREELEDKLLCTFLSHHESIKDFYKSQNQQLYKKIIEGVEKERGGNCQHKWEDIVCIGITGKIMCNECEETLLSTKIKSIKL